MTGATILGVRLACRDVAAVRAFWVTAFEAVADGEGLRLGPQRLDLVPATEAGGAPPLSNETGFQHCAIVVSDMDEATARLAATTGWSPISESGPERLPGASGGVTAFKFRDPEGHPLEFLQFPADCVPDAWAGIRAGPCLGIDHSAIGVAEAERSIDFYRRLGFRLASRQINRGAEQGRLDGLGTDTVVEVVTLECESGSRPHLELLCYQRPVPVARPARDGSPYATVLVCEAAGHEAGLVADPDGHRLWCGGGGYQSAKPD